MDDEYDEADMALEEYEEPEDVEDSLDQYESDEDLADEFKKEEKERLEKAKELLKMGAEKAGKAVSTTGAMAVKIGKGALDQYKIDSQAKKASQTPKKAGAMPGGLSMFMPSQSYAGESQAYAGDMFGVGSPKPVAKPSRKMKQKPDPMGAMLGFGSSKQSATSQNNDAALAMLGMGSSKQNNDSAFSMFGIQTKPKKAKKRKQKSKSRAKKKKK